MKKTLLNLAIVLPLLLGSCSEDMIEQNNPTDGQQALKATGITVRARGIEGSESIQLKVGGTTVATWTLSTSMQDYTASTSATGAVLVEFINDNGTSLDVQIDYVQYNSSTYQAENQSTNTGVWQNSSCGGSNSEWLHCNGYIQFPDIQGGSGGSEIWLEAECGNAGSLWNVPQSSTASNGLYVTIQSGNNSTGSSPGNSSGHITYNFNINSGGNYVLWGRVRAPSPTDDSFWVRVDNGAWFAWNNIAPSSAWTWDNCQTYNLSAGSHTLTIAYREDGTDLDKIYIGSNTPSGTGGSAATCSGGSSGGGVNPSPSWNVDGRSFQDGPSGTFDDVAVKDPSIVYSGGQYHLFYTGTNGSAWKIGYASATSISGLNNSSHTLLNSIGSGGGLAAPQVFWFGTKGRWFLIYQNGTTPSFSTNTDIDNPGGWTAARSMGFADGGIDYWCISEGSNVYLFYSANDGSHTIKRRVTSVSDFPYNWSSASTVATDVFEAPHVYKNNADGKYYMVVEDLGAIRWQELWTANSPGGTWTKVSEQWAHGSDLTYNADHWTDEVSHMEVLRAGTNELLEVSDLNSCEIIFQGVVSGNYSNYINVPYDLGIARNY